jgi:hypothetical protein
MRETKTGIEYDWDQILGNDRRTIQEFTDDELRDELERRRKAKEDGWNKPTKYTIDNPPWVW